MADVTFKIVQEGAVLETQSSGWKLEINKVAWNGNNPKWDIRPWNEDHTKMGKGITLTDNQLKALGVFIAGGEN